MEKRFYQTLFLTILMIFQTIQKSNANEPQKAVLKAILALKEIKSARRLTERYVKKQLDLPRWVKSTLGVVSAGLIKGEINTHKLKNFRYKTENLTIRPDLNFQFKDKTTAGSIKVDFSF